ncbi:MAG: hypothetical protein NTX61_07865 [Bacteroidetes bacterium]|nr:hypothetical protein [Bacteroidota bacterium]
MEKDFTDIQPKSKENLPDNDYQEDNFSLSPNRELFYCFDEKGNYKKLVDNHYEANRLIIKQGWDAVNERVGQVRDQIVQGKLSPLAFFMEKTMMEVTILADYSGFSKRKVRKHLTPNGFSKLSPSRLETYAKVFDITVEELLNPDLNAQTFINAGKKV